jgi:hypothetical protein
MSREINIAVVGASIFRGDDHGASIFRGDDHDASIFRGDDHGTGTLRGADNPQDEIQKLAYEVGLGIAAQGWNLVCGGLGGVMEAAARGAAENGGTTIGILPGYRHDEANPHIKIAIPTGLGHARNAVIAACADGLIAVGGEHGTLSEIALGLKLGKPVVDITVPGIRKRGIDRLLHADTPGEAIEKIKNSLEKS